MAKRQTRNGKASVHCYIEEALKVKADEIFASLGLTTSDAIAIFFRKCVAEGGFPFEVKMTPEQREEINKKYLAAAANARAKNKGTDEPEL